MLCRAGNIRFSGTQKSVFLKVSSGEHCVPCNFVHLVMLGGTCICLIVYLFVYQMKQIMERYMLKQTQVQLYPPERTHWNDDITKHWHFSGVFIVNFEKIPRLFLAFYCWTRRSVSGCIYQKRLKYRQVKITKHPSTGTNYAISTKQVKVQHEKKPVSNLKVIQILGFEQTSTKSIVILDPEE